ncbi:MAG TPA: hypothetical protein VF748_14855 [Candidatus Acidoferrum sp.]
MSKGNVTDAPRYTIGAEPEPGDYRQGSTHSVDYEAESAMHCLLRAKEIRADPNMMQRIKFHMAQQKERNERQERLMKEFI